MGTQSYDLYIGRTRLFALNLGVTGIEGEVVMTIQNASGELVLQMSASAGTVQSSYSKLLPPGKYSVSFHATGALSYRLKGIQITDPIGHVIDSATLSPQYQSPTDPDVFVYPNGLAIATAYLWLLVA